MTGSTVRYTPADLKAAATALVAGRTATGLGLDEHQESTVAADDLVGGRQLSPPANAANWAWGWEPTGLSVRVLAAHSGAGASTVALALATAAADTGLRVRLIDAAAPTWSGLAGATHTELGVVRGWRRGRRGETLRIERVADPVRTLDQVPTPTPEDHPTHLGLTVVDTGWSARELAAHPRCWMNTTNFTVMVVVTRAHTAALGQLEVLLDELAGHTVRLVVIGAKRWSGAALGAVGFRTRQLRDTAVFLPRLGSAAPALGPEPLPKHLLGAGRALLARINDTHTSTGTEERL